MNWSPMATPSFISVASIGRTMNLEPSEPFRNATRALPPTLTYNKKQGGEFASLPYFKELCSSFLFVFASQGLDAFDHEDDGKDDEQYAKNDLCVRTPVSAARLDRNDLILNGQCQ